MSKGNWILLSIILVLVLVIGFLFSWLVVVGNQNSNQNSFNQQLAYDIKNYQVYQVTEDSIISNLNATGSARTSAIIRVKPYLRVADKKIVEDLKTRNSEIIDIFITVLRSKTFEDIQQPNSKEVVKTEVINKLNEVFSTNKILDVFFEEFIVQLY